MDFYPNSFCKAICLSLLLWSLPWILNKYPDESFPFCGQDDIFYNLKKVELNSDKVFCPFKKASSYEFVHPEDIFTSNMEKEIEPYVFQDEFWLPLKCISNYPKV